MAEEKPRFTPEEVERLKAKGIFDVATTYQRVVITRKKKKHKFWDGYVPPEDRD